MRLKLGIPEAGIKPSPSRREFQAMHTEVSMPDKPRQMKYLELPTGNFFRIAEKPDAGEFFKCQSWVSITADLEKMFLCKPDVEIVVTNKSGSVNECEGGRDA
jgi:hypothetical protein